MTVRLLRMLAALAILLIPASVPTPLLAATCQFALGFKAIHDAIPEVVGDCVVDEHHNPDNGDGLQETTAWHGKGGLLVWRKADNWTAFTDGASTWINGPYGIQKRANAERFAWESGASTPPIAQSQDPFRFVGGFVPGWHWGVEWWSPSVDEDLVRTARDNGVTVLHVMLPQFEPQLGVYREEELAKLDHLVDSASRHGVYVMPSFIHAYGIVQNPSDPYYHPRGIEGLMNDQRLADAFRQRIATIVNRTNTANGRVYRDDPTILAWLLADEVVSAPFNYPQGAPRVTVPQLRSWIESTASYVKGLDRRHMVTVNTTAAIDSLKDDDWLKVFDAPSLDFVEAEDADLRIRSLAGNYPRRLLTAAKPTVVMLSFTSGTFDQARVCKDYPWQADQLRQATGNAFAQGAAGVVVFSWGSSLYRNLPSFDQCYNYNSTNEPISRMLKDASARLGGAGQTASPLRFVTSLGSQSR